MALTVVFDTNILLSATGWRGKPFECVEKARAGIIKAVTCPELIEELADKLESKLAYTSEESAAKLANYLNFIRIVTVPKTIYVVERDPDDNVVIECAVEGQAQYIVTGDRDLLDLKRYEKIEIIRASEFLEVLTMR